ncbi:hypothetical protein SUGI_0623590 [Cryptomeria japonica]|nr:hypothetical protein SUGI_0623590 [Cryptomeria japonica]
MENYQQKKGVSQTANFIRECSKEAAKLNLGKISLSIIPCRQQCTTSGMRWRKEQRDKEFINNICITLTQRSPSIWDSVFHEINLVSQLTPELVAQVLLKIRRDAEASFYFFNWVGKQKGFKHTLHSISIAILTLSCAGLLNPAKTLIRQNSTNAPALFDALLSACKSRQLVFDLLLETYSQDKMIPEAFNTFYRMRDCEFKPSVRACNEVLHTLWTLNVIEVAWKFYWAMVQNGIGSDEYTFSILVQMLCKEGKVEDSVQLIGEMKKNGCQLDVALYNIALDGHFKEGKVTEGLKLLGHMFMKGLIPDFATYSSILNGLCRFRRTEEANRLFEDMLHKNSVPITDAATKCSSPENDSETLGIVPELVTCNAFVIELCRLAKMDAAELVFKKILDKGLIANGSVYNAMIDGYGKEGRIKEALQMHGEMLQYNLMLNSSSCKPIVNALCINGKVVEARKIFSTMLERGFVADSADYSILITAYCKEGNLEEANKLFHGMLEIGLMPSINTCCTLVRQYCKEGSTDEALYLHDKLKEYEILLDIVTYNALLQELCQKKQMQEADNIFYYMQNKGMPLTTITYTTMVRGHCKAENFREALKLHDEMLQKDLKPDIATYKDLIAGFDI